MRMTGERDGRPAKVGIAMNDIAAGVTALYAILGSYIRKLKTGEGIFLDTSLLEAGFAWTFWEFGAFFGAGELPMANGTRHRRNAPYQAFRTQDGYVTIGGNNDKLWKSLCTDVLARPGLLGDPRFNPVEARLRNVDALQDEIEAVLATASTAHWVAKLDAAGVPGGPVYTYDQAVADPHVLARGMVTELDHPKIGRMKNMGSPVKASAEFTRTPEAAPWLGQHSDATLKGLGMTDEQVSALHAKAVIYDKYRPAKG
jgi:crotonobetainyl-CoA:carnitine CoA-transferase CaiB-like acyl-CoA transferase